MSMNEPVPLRPEDRAAFESALSKALAAPDVRAALGRPGAPHTAGELRARALAAADSLAAEASPEYAALLDARSGPAPGASPAGGTGARAAVAVLTVLTPLLSIAAAVIFLLLGYGLRVAGASDPLAGTLVATGWTAAVIAAVTGLAAGAGLAFTAARHRATQGHAQPAPDALAQAHAAWLHALVQRALLPHLRRELGLRDSTPDFTDTPPAPAPGPAPGKRARLGYSRPDFASPDFAGPDFAGPDFTGPARHSSE
ncbi:hypothetical protein BEN35_26495 [Streptomyces fradiae]|nr:hypothetical protein BEN35_26495 [Streptomyces fradiae]